MAPRSIRSISSASSTEWRWRALRVWPCFAIQQFVVADRSRPFLEQAGRADVDVYRAACGWLDEQSRYEGGDCFRRIDAATERVDESVRDVSPPLFHDPIVGLPPDPTAWRGWDG